ncbi:DNA ligase D [Montanilutibacter psychrotolerans]|uniref:DNA ligase (ATP) n=1 Tax=Montanilutibacter psychrotolerans TaxID=1327343 RepID=A0A3M8SVT7_9GAMM|nr:DNA ligase D [Lysobacter psychrotolerans]RNF83344.1 DNA ligase D [Lysobacter psychrotolerans]
MTLTEYRRKRQFANTREPEPGKALPPGERSLFVVQLHHASRRHYDFRLQIGDALKSWAVPKGPSFDPSVKRMAVEVEDHPVEYAKFEGDIPKGQYGAGHVALFDTGVWSTDGDPETQLAKGHLRFELFGQRLKGGWHLVRSGKSARQPQWLLIKDNDAWAGPHQADDLLTGVSEPSNAGSRTARAKRPTAVPATPSPRAPRKRDWAGAASRLAGSRKATLQARPFELQLAKPVGAPPGGDDWVHEIKWDGYRMGVTLVAGRAHVWSRNGLDWTRKLPEIATALERLGVRDAAFDGELIAGGGTRDDFGRLQAILSGQKQGALRYVLFDLLHLEGQAIDESPLTERKHLLERLLSGAGPHLAFSSHIPGDGAAAFALADTQAFEGIVSKRGDRPYRTGRSDDWRKTRHVASEDFAVVGYMPGKGGRGGLGSLLLARSDPRHGWRYAGRVGSGFSDAQVRDLTARIGKSGTSKASVLVGEREARELRGARWFAPMFVVEAFHRGISSSGLLRQPSLKAVRLDREVAELVERNRANRDADADAETAKPAARSEATAMRLSSPGKIVYPDRGYTKRDVVDYYTKVIDWLLPEIVGRPLSVVRCPDGTGKACFFQKHHTAGMQRVDLVPLKEDAGNQADYLVVRDAEGLLELVQFNAVEFHPWGAMAESPDVANRVVFDLDPGSGVAWGEVRDAARHVRDLLAGVGLQSFLRTTGGKGLHVVVPLNPGCDWVLVKRFAHGFADALAQADPRRYIAVSALKRRHGRIFVDYLRNGRGATSIASYSLRAREGAPVAMPLDWTQLSRLSRPDAYTLGDVPARLKRRRKDPWQGIDEILQDLSQWATH